MSSPSWQSLQESWHRARSRMHRDPDAASTAARSLLESTCKTGRDEHGTEHENKWDVTHRARRPVTVRELGLDQAP